MRKIQSYSNPKPQPFAISHSAKHVLITNHPFTLWWIYFQCSKLKQHILFMFLIENISIIMVEYLVIKSIYRNMFVKHIRIQLKGVNMLNVVRLSVHTETLNIPSCLESFCLYFILTIHFHSLELKNDID